MEAEDAEVQVDMSSLIDMVFILLIFFIVSTTFVKDHAVEVVRPKAQTSVPANKDGFKVYVKRDGSLYLNGSLVHVSMVQGRAREFFKRATDKTGLVVADENLPTATLIRVIDQVRLGGADNVAIVSEQEAS